MLLAACCVATAAVAQVPEFDLTAIDGRVLRGSLVVSAGGVVEVRTAGETIRLQLEDVMAISNTAQAEAVPAAPPMAVWLRSGTVLPALHVGGLAAAGDKPSRLVVEAVGGARIEVPLTTVAALRSRKITPESFDADRGDPSLNKDYLYVVKDGTPQRFSVDILSVHDGKVHFDLRGNSYEYPLTGNDSVAGVVFGRNTGFAPDRQGRPRVRVQTAAGEAVEGKLLDMDGSLRVGLDEGVEFTADSRSVRRIDVLSDKLTWLNVLEPKVEQTAAFDRPWPWTIDSSPAGPGLVIAGKQFTRGLCLVPRTRLSFDIGGRYDFFEAVIGIDDRGGPQAHAIFRVLGDGKVLYESAPKTLGAAAEPVRVALNKCKVLAIEADFGKNFDLGDLCAFADARIIQQ